MHNILVKSFEWRNGLYVIQPENFSIENQDFFFIFYVIHNSDVSLFFLVINYLENYFFNEKSSVFNWTFFGPTLHTWVYILLAQIILLWVLSGWNLSDS